MALPRPITRDALPSGPSSILAAHHLYGDASRCEAPVVHAHAALAFYTGGSARVEQRGEWSLRAGDVFVVPAGQPHRMLDARRPEAWAVSFCVPCFAADGAASLLAPFERVRDGASAVVSIPAARQEWLSGLFRELAAVDPRVRRLGDDPEAVQRSLLTLILAEVDTAAQASVGPRAAGGGIAVDALRYIERHCLGPLTLRDVASAVGRSPAHVTTALTRTTGRSAVQWIVSGRMAEARRRLLHTDEMVDVVADRVGYADATHFIRMFRRQHGATPAAWRAAHLPERLRALPTRRARSSARG